MDESFQSYYGHHKLQYIQLLGGRERQDVHLFDGQLLDAKWLPDCSGFIVISGNQPATTTLYNKNCEPAFEFGKRYRNTIRINAFSNIAMIGGFGNLKGDLDFWDLEKMKEISNSSSYCAVSTEWLPNGKHFFTAVLYERVKVDNEYRVISASGKTLFRCNLKNNQLNSVQFKPRKDEEFKKPDLE